MVDPRSGRTNETEVLTDEEITELRRLSNPPYEQEEADTM